MSTSQKKPTVQQKKPAAQPAEKAAFKPKKSVALSGVVAGNTALCTVGRTGNDLHYRGYDILDFAGSAEFEEIAHLLVHGKLPNKAELKAYKEKQRVQRAAGHRAALLQQHQVIGQPRHFVGRMADVDHRDVQFVVQALQVGQDFALALHVQRRQRLVHQQQARAGQQRAGDAHALAFA
ncbi:citrate (Si)-synthase domain protein, partial [Bordetella bronchiseptica D989]